MGRGRSGAGKSGGGGGNASTPKAKTPSGVDYDSFMKMSDAQKFSTIQDIIKNPNIQVPDYLDDSETSKVLYALGMNNKPQVVSDSQLDSMPGREIYRTVYEKGSMPPPQSDEILDQIRTGDFTQLSGRGGSAHGRALYFATDFGDSASYGTSERNAMVMRAKINPNAKIVKESTIRQQMQNDPNYAAGAVRFGGNKDSIALYALSHGIDGWYSGTYTMMVNRGMLTASSQNKRIGRRNTKNPTRTMASSWKQAANAR